jgi:hypothetical protein
VKVSVAAAGAMVVMALLSGTDDPGAGCRFLVLKLGRFVSLIWVACTGASLLGRDGSVDGDHDPVAHPPLSRITTAQGAGEFPAKRPFTRRDL